MYPSRQAEDDLIDIWLHIAGESPTAADRLLDRIERRWLQLADHPNSGQSRDDLTACVRQLVVGEYISFYRVEAREVVILRVLHGRRRITGDDMAG